MSVFQCDHNICVSRKIVVMSKFHLQSSLYVLYHSLNYLPPSGFFFCSKPFINNMGAWFTSTQSSCTFFNSQLRNQRRDQRSKSPLPIFDHQKNALTSGQQGFIVSIYELNFSFKSFSCGASLPCVIYEIFIEMP